MATLLITCAALLGLAALMLLSQRAAAFIAAKRLSKRRPFSCATCLTFWLTLAVLALVAAVCPRFDVLHAVLFAFINYFYIKTKVTIYE